MSKSILVCGGAGYIGSHVVRESVGLGYRVIIVDNLSTGHEESVPDGVDLVRGSIGDHELLEAVFVRHDIQAVVHLCANTYVGESMENPRKYYSNNIGNGLVLLETMLDHDVKHIVFSSSCTVYGLPERVPIDEKCRIAPISPYGHTKAMFEQIMSDFSRSHGLRYCALRYFNAAGASDIGDIGEDHDPETHVIPLALRQVLRKEFVEAPEAFFTVLGGDYNTPDGTCIRDYIHVEDIARAHCQAIEYLGKGSKSVAINLANEKGTSVLEILQTCEEVTGHEIQYNIGPRRPGDPDELVGSAAKARDVLDWKPEASDVRNVIETAWKWHKTHPDGYTLVNDRKKE